MLNDFIDEKTNYNQQDFTLAVMEPHLVLSVQLVVNVLMLQLPQTSALQALMLLQGQLYAHHVLQVLL